MAITTFSNEKCRKTYALCLFLDWISPFAIMGGGFFVWGIL